MTDQTAVRKRIEWVLRRHISFDGKEARCLKLEPCDDLLNDLLACYPEPSREAAENRIKELLLNLKHGPISLDIEVAWWLRWATGQPEAKTWCADIAWVQRQDEGWELIRGLRRGDHVPPDWTVCPICAAPRPG